MSALAVLAHRVCELRDSVAGRSQPFLNLGQMEDDLPVSPSVQRWRLLGPETKRSDLQVGALHPAVTPTASNTSRMFSATLTLYDCLIGAVPLL